MRMRINEHCKNNAFYRSIKRRCELILKELRQMNSCSRQYQKISICIISERSAQKMLIAIMSKSVPPRRAVQRCAGSCGHDIRTRKSGVRHTDWQRNEEIKNKWRGTSICSRRNWQTVDTICEEPTGVWPSSEDCQLPSIGSRWHVCRCFISHIFETRLRLSTICSENFVLNFLSYYGCNRPLENHISDGRLSHLLF